MNTIRFIDLFAGIGGFRYGLENIRVSGDRGSRPTHGGSEKDIQPEREMSTIEKSPFTCVYSNEWDRYASQIYKKHYGECDTRDITTVPSSEIPDFDLLCGGFPCQAFSIAGKRKGFDDTRGTLFFEIVRILADKRPRYFLLENVKGLLSHDNGKTFQTILGVLTDLGYEYQWQVLNSKDFGVPQNRERVFIIGNSGGTPRPEVFPIGGDNETDTRNVGQEISYAIDTNYWKGRSSEGFGGRQMIKQLNNPTHSNDRIYGEEGVSPALNTMQGGRRQPKIVASRGRYNKDGATSQKLESRKDGVTNTLTGVEKDNRVMDGVRVRRLTPTECARLQGFPDNWHEGLSDTQAYKCYGNAVSTPVITEIGKRLL